MVSGQFIDFYDFFQVSPDADITEIKAAHRQKLIDNHPDNQYENEEAKKQAEKNLEIALQGLNILSDKTYRKEYDKAYYNNKTNNNKPILDNTVHDSFIIYEDIMERAKSKEQTLREAQIDELEELKRKLAEAIIHDIFNNSWFKSQTRTDKNENYDYTEIINLKKQLEEEEKKISENLEKSRDLRDSINDKEFKKIDKIAKLRMKIYENEVYIKAKKYTDKIHKKDANPLTTLLITKNEWDEFHKQANILNAFEKKIKEYEETLNQEINKIKEELSRVNQEYHKIMEVRNQLKDKYTFHPLKYSYESTQTNEEENHKTR